MPAYIPRTVTASTTLDPSFSDGQIVVNAAAGLTLTLPPATGSGFEYRIVIGTTVTSNSVVIRVNSASDWMSGNIFVSSDNAADAAISFESPGGALASRGDTITLNGTTTGGILGDRYSLIDVAANTWALCGWATGTGTEVTPLSAAV